VSCERGDIRQSLRGVVVHDQHGAREVGLADFEAGGDAVISELCESVDKGTDPPHGVVWATGSVAVCNAILEAGRTGEPVLLPRRGAAE
jgi:hypothetical protein